MAIATKVRRIGNSLGITLPKEALHTLKVEEGETLYLTEGAHMKVAENLMGRYRNALRELAK